MKIEDSPTPIGVTDESIRMCWSCECETAVAWDDFKEVNLQRSDERGPKSSRVRFCSRECREA